MKQSPLYAKLKRAYYLMLSRCYNLPAQTQQPETR
jgi:hypothetical protein